MKWIRERNATPEEFPNHGDFKTREDFLGLLAEAESTSPGLVASVAEELTASDAMPDIESLREQARQRTYLPIDPDMLLVMACASALAKAPRLETWKRVRQIAYHSWQIENWLTEAMLANIQSDAGATEAYVALGILLFDALDSGELRAESTRKNDARDGAWARWKAARFQLEELWWGGRDSDLVGYEDEMRIFGLLSHISPSEFLRLIATSNNPLLVETALLSAGVGAFSPSFAQWESCVRAAPRAFQQDGTWTGSVLLPLLLAHARDELLDPGRQIPRHGAIEGEVEALTAEVKALANAVVAALAGREDAPAMFSRWGTWLMRQIIGQRQQDHSDIRSYDFVDNALLEAIGNATKESPLKIDAPTDAAPWESWCCLCVQSSFAHAGIASAPSFGDFASEWLLTPEDWYGPKGRGLLERAALHVPRDDIPGLSANLLALPLASKNGFASEWELLWDSAHYLREVLEFGCPDAGSDEFSDRADASRLLLLLGCIGMACFDQVAARLDTQPDQTSEEVARLHEALASAAMDVLHIDDTLTRDKWRTYLQYLALRRAFWDRRYTGGQRVALFADTHKPAIRDYLRYFQADQDDLVAFLHACILNRLDASELRGELQDAAVDLRGSVDTLKRLHGLRAHRYPVDSRAIDAIAPLM